MSLDSFLPPVKAWFRKELGEPTPAQRGGWPAIRAKENTLILAPTGSGKTLAAFLACLDDLWRRDPLPPGIGVLYVSPLKALNNDIYRNLQLPLAGVAAMAESMGQLLPKIEVALRTGDTPAAERRRLLRQPPHVLITTPESLHLLLTSRARETLRGVNYCIVDEIHAVCANKRGVFLALLLERLQALNPQGFVRIGLSATQRPLDEVARYLGGSELTTAGLLPRPVTIVDAGMRKDLDLRVINPVEQFGPLPEKSIWPSICRLLTEQIRQHRSTIIFANNRRTVERITAQLNEPEEIAHAHHGSVSLEARQKTEQDLKEGRLPAVVATASLELGIDMGAVDLVCQVESPGSVARGLQRVGRAGHLVGQRSKGRLIPKTPADLVEQAVLAHEMAAGRVEEMRVPRNCLDVLAQQVVAMVAMDSWDVPTLYSLVRQAYPFRDLSPQVFDTVLEMVSGRYRWQGADKLRPTLAALQPRISWDRVHNRLLALPGSQRIALVNGGTIPDTGQYAAYAGDGARIGELDEEFIYERRVGDVFLLGTTAWRLERIEADRVRVVPAEGAPATMPFWRGEKTGRSYDLGLAIGRFLREVAARQEQADCQEWLEREFFLDAAAAKNLLHHVRRQIASADCLPTDQTILVERFRDSLGDWQVVLLSPFGSRLHFALRLALEARLRQRLGYTPQCLHHDDGILIRLTDTDEPVQDILDGLTPDSVQGLILGELADSALFALRFRQNAARALLLPRMRPGKRAPLWLQRLRGRDLLQVARRQPDFPIVAETFRECLHDHLDVDRLERLLADVRSGQVRVVTRRPEGPSPFASGLLFAFTAGFMYVYDGTEADPSRAPALDQQLLEQLIAPRDLTHLLDPRAIHHVERRLRGLGQLPRTAAEMAEWLRRLGDVAPSELLGPMDELVDELASDGRAKRIQLAGCREPERWILAEEETLYQQAFALEQDGNTRHEPAAQTILDRFMQTHALVGLDDLLERYPFSSAWAHEKLEEWVRCGRAIAVPTSDEMPARRWSSPSVLEQVKRSSLAFLRHEVITRTPAQFADFVLRWQHVHPSSQRGGVEGLGEVLTMLEGQGVQAESWEQSVLPGRLPAYQSRWLDESIAAGEWLWLLQSDGDSGKGLLAFISRDHLAVCPAPVETSLDDSSRTVLDYLRNRGASFVPDLAQATNLAPSMARSTLWTLLRRGLVTNDRFDVIRKGEEAFGISDQEHPDFSKRRPTFSSLRRQSIQRPEGRWSLLPWGNPSPVPHALYMAGLLLRRYGLATRELAAVDPLMPPWRVLYEVLNRLELSGDVRRGYFVEGLSGVQFALPQAAQLLQDLDLPSTMSTPVILLHSLDPANLYGSGAPFSVTAADGNDRPLLRRAGNWLVLRAGRPILLIEQQGRRLTALASASRAEVGEAVSCLPRILSTDHGLSARNKLTVDEWNDLPVATTEGADLLAAAGLVRDYQSMTLYGTFR